MNDRIAVLSKYSRLGASSRLRTIQYREHLEREGFDVTYTSFFDDAYLNNFYSGKKNGPGVLRYYRDRLSRMRTLSDANLIWVEYEALPWVPWLIEKSFLPKSVPIVSDYDDAIFHRYDRHRLAPVRWLCGQKIDRVMRRSALVTAGNDYLADRARQAGSAQVQIVPTVVDLEAYTPRKDLPVQGRAQVGWIGTPNTWDDFGQDRYEQLHGLLAARNAVFQAVGAQVDASDADTLKVVPWSENTEVSAIQGMDIGVMPLPDTPWTRGKCGYKLIQYMACGLPVVASSVGVNSDIVEHGVNGFLVRTDEEWNTALDTLLSDGDLRRRMGAAGREKVERNYSLQIWGPRLAGMFRRVAEEGRRA